VKQSIAGVLREGAIAAGLTALMILLFLGSWRSTLVVMISIPLAILASIVTLYFLGETLNTMTLGGLALAIGILVDDSTVTIENTHRLLNEEGQPLPQATLHGAAGIAVPTLVSTLAISCVFTSVVFLEGPAKYLFTPLGLAVVFAMLASYGLSRTLTPITIGLLLKSERHGASSGWFGRFNAGFERGFETMRGRYAALLATLLTRRLIVPVIAVMIPLIKLVPPIYRWRVRSRIYRWYARLKEIELQLEENPGFGRLEDMLQRLENIDNAVNKIPTPLAYSENLYSFRQHVDLVQQRVIARMARVKREDQVEVNAVVGAT